VGLKSAAEFFGRQLSLFQDCGKRPAWHRGRTAVIGDGQCSGALHKSNMRSSLALFNPTKIPQHATKLRGRDGGEPLTQSTSGSGDGHAFDEHERVRVGLGDIEPLLTQILKLELDRFLSHRKSMGAARSIREDVRKRRYDAAERLFVRLEDYAVR
jgi:hypothetical protein